MAANASAVSMATGASTPFEQEWFDLPALCSMPLVRASSVGGVLLLLLAVGNVFTAEAIDPTLQRAEGWPEWLL